jgi:cysteine-rich repeat protein
MKQFALVVVIGILSVVLITGTALAVCGDAFIDPGEECDDGDTNDYNACRNDCTIYDPYFSDVPGNKWFFEYAQRLFEYDISQGYPDGTYKPLNKVSRAEMAAYVIKTIDLLKGVKIAIVDTSGNNYSDPVEAMDDIAFWCGVPSAENPCHLKILPGVYDIGQNSLQMQEYVNITGSWGNITTIKGNPGSNSAGVVNGADNAALRNVKVVNTGGGTYAIAIYNNNASPRIKSVTAKASNGGTYSRGIYNVSSSPNITNVKAVASGGVSSEAIVNNNSSSPKLYRVTATASGGGTNSRGIYNSSSSPVIINTTATASGAPNNYGIYSISAGSTVRIEHSIIDASTTLWNGSGATTYVAHTRLQGGTVNNSGTLKCIGAYNGVYNALNNTCQ